MKILKFRAFNKIERTMYQMEERTWLNEFFMEIEEMGSPVYAEPEQWTGLTDKNGVEIYEGDIVRVVTKALPSEADDSGYAYVGKVEFDHGAYMINFGATKFGFRNELSAWALNHTTVLGNTHQNPDLLTP